MSGKELMQTVIEKCDLYFEGKLISKESLIRTYACFIAETFAEKEHNVAIVLHTGSICFDIVSVTAAAISNLILNDAEVDDVLDSIEIGDTVLFQKERYIFSGYANKDLKNVDRESLDICHILLKQEKEDKNLTKRIDKKWIKFDNRYQIEPYNGESRRMDGRGIRKDYRNRNNFIATVFDIPENKIPSITNTSSIIVMSRELSDRILNNLEIRYGKNKLIRILDIVTASYYTEGDNYSYGGNPGRVEPILKITSRVSVARDLIFGHHETKITGLVTVGYDNYIKSKTELPELINRRSLLFVYITYHIDSENGEALVRECEDANVFACTKEFLLSNSMPIEIFNQYTIELNTQVGNITNKKVDVIIINALHTWNEYKVIKKTLHFIRKSDVGDAKDRFIILAGSLLNLFTTAVFTMEQMESMILSHELDGSILSPQKRLEEMKELSASLPDTLADNANHLIKELELMYTELEGECGKAKKLIEYIDTNKNKRIAVIVPKAYYETILNKTLSNKYCMSDINITTANKFDNTMLYDGIIVAGDFKGKRFDTFKSKASARISVLLYEFENRLFNYRMREATHSESLFNSKSRIKVELDEYINLFYDVEDSDDDVCEIEEISDGLDSYIIKLNEFTARSIIQKSINEFSTIVDVSVIGTFVDGENIFFTKGYRAYVFDENCEEVKETGIDNLSSGDTLVFTKRDNFTKSIVDEVLENLLIMGLLNGRVHSEYEKSKHWKNVLRDYMDNNKLTYVGLAKELSLYGLTKHSATISNWLREDSYIVGPEDEESYVHIAKLTKDKKMLEDPISYCKACQLIRNERRKILKLIGKSIINKLRGNQIENDEVLEAVYDNVEKLAIKLQLDTITEVEERLQAPVNMVNRPIAE